MLLNRIVIVVQKSPLSSWQYFTGANPFHVSNAVWTNVEAFIRADNEKATRRKRLAVGRACETLQLFCLAQEFTSQGRIVAIM
jgi:hypothetical protein